MQKEDILVTDIRITALGDSGQYVFEWKDKDSKIAYFSPESSDYDEVPDEVKSALKLHNISLVDRENNTGNSNKSSLDVEVPPVSQNDYSNEKETANINSQNTKNENSAEILETSEPELEIDTNIDDDVKEVSYIVRMNSSKERDEETRKKGLDEDVIDKFNLSGPYRINYSIKDGEITLDSVEDLGLGLSTKNRS